MGTPTTNMTTKAITGVGRIAKVASATLGRNSITRMTADSIFQFPLIISSSIDVDYVETIGKAFERQYATLVLSAISLNNSVDIDKYDNASEFLKKFHSNKDIPMLVKAATNFTLESANFVDVSRDENTEASIECWGLSDIGTRKDNINDIYRPYDRTKAILQNRIDLSKATEAANISGKLDDLGKAASRDMDNISTKTDGVRSGKSGIRSEKMEIVRNEKFMAMEPTVLNVQLIFHGNGVNWAQNVVVGVKSMVRMVRSDMMVANMVEASKGSNGIFKYIKWLNGEINFFKDIILGIGDSRDSANATANNRWLSALKRRKSIDSIMKFTSTRVPPNTTIVITKYEASQIADACGINLTENYNALKLISKYYLLAFAIFDTETNVLSTLFDGETDFAEASITTIKSGNAKAGNAMDAKEMLKLIGRI